jgi:hypothetical protein
MATSGFCFECSNDGHAERPYCRAIKLARVAHRVPLPNEGYPTNLNFAIQQVDNEDGGRAWLSHVHLAMVPGSN